jgi:hypothetical protein
VANRAAVGVMSGAELRSTREVLGLSPVWMARYLEMSEREYDHMERGKAPIYRGVAEKVQKLADEATRLVDTLAESYDIAANKGYTGDAITMRTYRTDSDYEHAQRALFRGAVLTWSDIKPVRWHHHICARVVAEVPAVRIEYLDVAVGEEAAS